VAHVADAARAVYRRDLRAGHLLERRQQLVQADAATAGHVDHLSHRSRRIGGEQVGAHGVRNEGEVAALFAVAVDRAGSPRRHAVAKRGTTAAYSLLGSWRGPNTLK
jgi:hypothetical protein